MVNKMNQSKYLDTKFFHKFVYLLDNGLLFLLNEAMQKIMIDTLIYNKKLQDIAKESDRHLSFIEMDFGGCIYFINACKQFNWVLSDNPILSKLNDKAKEDISNKIHKYHCDFNKLSKNNDYSIYDDTIKKFNFVL